MAKHIYTDEACSAQVGLGQLSIPSLKMLMDAPTVVTAQAPAPSAPAPTPLATPAAVTAPVVAALGKAAPQAAALVRAAQSGAPFCEQCARMA